MYQEIPLNKMPDNSLLFNEYLNNSNWRKNQLGYDFINLELDFKNRLEDLKKQSFDRLGLSRAIKKYMAEFGLSEKTNANLEKLKKPDCVCIVAGQQPALFGGPLYNFYKAITAIKIATQMGLKLGRPFVPIFWNGSNDHDVDESNRFYYLDKHRRMIKGSLSGVKSQTLDRMVIGKEVLTLKSKIENEMSRVDFLEEVWQILLPQNNDTIGGWQTRILNQLFGKDGLLILEPKILKEISPAPFAQLLEKEDSFIKQIKVNSENLKSKNYGIQVDTEVSSRLMVYQKDSGRYRLKKVGPNWTDGKQSWNNQELIEKSQNTDFDLTPDALGRPLWQDMIIPVAAYIAGPGEIAYFHQLKGCYELFGMKMPLILARESGTFLEKNHIKFMDHYKISNDQFYDFKKWSVVPINSIDSASEIPADLFENWRKKAFNPDEMRLFEKFKSKFEKLNQKFYENLHSNRKNNADIGNKQLQEWKDFIFPMNLTQERVYGLLPLMARHGTSVLQFLEKEPYHFGKHFIYTLND